MLGYMYEFIKKAMDELGQGVIIIHGLFSCKIFVLLIICWLNTWGFFIYFCNVLRGTKAL